jgi:hypothetical protein
VITIFSRTHGAFKTFGTKDEAVIYFSQGRDFPRRSLECIRLRSFSLILQSSCQGEVLMVNLTIRLMRYIMGRGGWADGGYSNDRAISLKVYTLKVRRRQLEPRKNRWNYPDQLRGNKQKVSFLLSFPLEADNETYMILW